MLEKYNTKLRVLAAMTTVLFIFCSSDGYNVKITNENGIEVVVNPDYPKIESVTMKLEEVISIGEKDGDINNTFYRLNDINIDNKGNIFTVDVFDKIVRVFDNTGKFKNTIGRSGQGPGEFTEPARIFINNKGAVYIHDSGNESRITRFSAESEYIDDFKIGIGNKLIGIDIENNLYITDRLSWDMTSGSVERSFRRLDKNGNALNTVTTLEGQRGTPTGGGAGSWNTGYEHGAINYVIRKNGDLIAGTSDRYMFTVYDKLGK
jgi:hypothetical protein